MEMSRTSKNGKSDQDYIPLLYARNIEEAEYYQNLLKEHEIPVMIDEEYADVIDPAATEPGIPVLVPDDHLDEAEAILDQEESIDEVFGADDESEETEQEEELEPLNSANEYDTDDSLGPELEDNDDDNEGENEEERF
jgi:hypothetical protein